MVPNYLRWMIGDNIQKVNFSIKKTARYEIHWWYTTLLNWLMDRFLSGMLGTLIWWNRVNRNLLYIYIPQNKLKLELSDVLLSKIWLNSTKEMATRRDKNWQGFGIVKWRSIEPHWEIFSQEAWQEWFFCDHTRTS